MLRDIVKMIDDVNLKVSKVRDKTDFVVTICIAMIIIQLILFMVLLSENRFKLITKCCGYICGEKSPERKFNIFESRKYGDYRVLKYKRPVESVLDNQNPLMTFRVEGYCEDIELPINNRDCVVYVKKQISEKLENGINYKTLKLKFNGKILDDNQYLLSAFRSRGEIVSCVVDNTVTASDIVVVKQQDITDLPQFLQFRKDKSVKEIKKNIANLLKSDNFKIFKESNELEDSKNIGDYVTMDNDSIRVIKCERGRVVLHSMFDESERLEVEYSNVDKISSIVQTISKTFGSDSKYIILFIDILHLIEDKCIFQYNINVNSKILFYYPMNLDNIEFTEDSPIDSGFTSLLYQGKDVATNSKVLIKYYKGAIEFVIDRKLFMEELTNYSELVSNRRFVRVIGVNRSKDLLGVVMECAITETLNNLLKRVKSFLEQDIHGYVKQIIEAVKYLHDKGIPYCSLTPYNIFVDDQKNIKLSSFNLSKYFHRIDLNQVLDIKFKSTDLSESYVAPEMKIKKCCIKSSDVWSLGVILIGFVNGGEPVVRVNDITKEVSHELVNTVSDHLGDLIKACLKYDPNQRPTIDQLMEHEFFKQFQ